METIVFPGVVRNGRVETDAPLPLPEGSLVSIAGVPNDLQMPPADDGPMTADEIARALLAMSRLLPLDPGEPGLSTADDWERKANEYSIAQFDRGLEQTFR